MVVICTCSARYVNAYLLDTEAENLTPFYDLDQYGALNSATLY